ncbi:hypothetical protein ACJX0J_031968, partial [Zea mays]
TTTGVQAWVVGLPVTASQLVTTDGRKATDVYYACSIGGGGSTTRGRDGSAAVLRQAGGEAGAVDGGGGPQAHQLHPHQRPLLLARGAQARRPAALRQELPPALDQLPPPGPQARAPHGRRGAGRHRPPRQARQQ